MNCPYCDKLIRALTGLQELQKFQKHLRTCKKNPKRQVIVKAGGDIAIQTTYTGMMEALDIRAKSGQ